MYKKFFIGFLSILLLTIVLVSCDETVLLQEPLTQGLYYNGTAGLNVLLLEVDDNGTEYQDYLVMDDFEIEGFAYHSGYAGTAWEIIDEKDCALQYLYNSKAPVRLYCDEYTGAFYVNCEKSVKDWITVLDEANKYEQRIFIREHSRAGIIELTKKGDDFIADKSLIKSITILTGPEILKGRHDLVRVEGKELKLIDKNRHPLGVSVDVKVCLERGIAKQEVFVNVFIAGIAPL